MPLKYSCFIRYYHDQGELMRTFIKQLKKALKDYLNPWLDVIMPETTRTFRIFVSSTFSDLKAERNALQERVFPKLQELCRVHGTRFQAIDLRWGVNDEVGIDQQTMKICLSEIERCQKTTPRPNFIVLLGDRYGWCPLPTEIPDEEFEQILHNITNTDDKELLCYRDDQPQNQKGWYRLDRNAVPPVYCLQPRTGEFTDSVKWGQIENQLRSILLKGIKNLNFQPEKNLKYKSFCYRTGNQQRDDESQRITRKRILLLQIDSSTPEKRINMSYE